MKTALRERFSAAGIIGVSKALRDVLEIMERVAQTDVPVLITGETGTGKGLIAWTLHAQSDRAAGQPEPLDES